MGASGASGGEGGKRGGDGAAAVIDVIDIGGDGKARPVLRRGRFIDGKVVVEGEAEAAPSREARAAAMRQLQQELQEQMQQQLHGAAELLRAAGEASQEYLRAWSAALGGRK